MRTVNEFRHRTDALDVSARLVLKIRPAVRPEARLDDPTPHSTSPGGANSLSTVVTVPMNPSVEIRRSTQSTHLHRPNPSSAEDRLPLGGSSPRGRQCT